MRNRDVDQSKRRAGWPFAVAAIGAFFWVGALAVPAQADSNFERGFEDQMGRILAFEAVNLGKAVLFQGVVHPIAHNAHAGYSGYGYGGHPGPGYNAGYQGHGDHGKRYVNNSRRRVPVYTHDNGRRPYRFRGQGYGHDDHHGKWKQKHHGKNYGNHGGHGSDCGHH